MGREPDLSYVLNTGRAVTPHLRPGTLVVLESSTYPGTTDGELREVLEVGSGMRAQPAATYPNPNGIWGTLLLVPREHTAEVRRLLS